MTNLTIPVIRRSTGAKARLFVLNSTKVVDQFSTMSKWQNTENTNEWINWIEEDINKEYFKYYEYKEFAKVYRANWKGSEQCLALKSFFNLDNISIKEIVHEVIFNYNALYIYFSILILYN